MKVVILAGGFGTRISEETMTKPKPMIEVGGYPILWHIMKIYSHFGFNEFVICLGYKGYILKEYFANYFLHQSDVTFNMTDNSVEYHKSKAENWKITLVDTGDESMTGGRIKRAKPYLNNRPFMLTYGDAVANIDIKSLVQFHNKNKAMLTVTAVQPSGRFGAMDITKSNRVSSFHEKPKGDGGWINGGFFVCQPEVIDYIDTDDTIWEKKPLEQIASNGELVAFQHTGFWKPMDTLRDKRELEELWSSGKAPWKLW